MIGFPLGSRSNILLVAFQKLENKMKKPNSSAGRPPGDFSDNFRVSFSLCLNHHILRFSGELLTSLLKKSQNFLNQICFENVFGWLVDKSVPLTYLTLQNMF
jgi:hypothetical protein